ncbi:MAG: RIP metalloprotease RseP [Oscillatoriales cyanobacterium]|nr:MAG: RIP metalloprotease RseP [Oscillatoriales cyanobacterium]
MSVLVAIGVLALLVFVHELGHFAAARLQGIYANKFSIGFGPVLWKYQGSQTEYALRAIPLGGFVGFPDDDENSPIPPNDPNLMRNRPIADRAIVIAAGVVANLIFAYGVLAAQYGILGVPDGFRYEPGVIVPQVLAPDNPAGRAGLKAGDVVQAIDGQSLAGEQASVKQLMEQIKASPDRPLILEIQRGPETLKLRVQPETDETGQGRIGVQLAPNGKPIYRRAKTPIEVLSLAADRFEGMVTQTVSGFVTLAANFREVAPQVSGPVKIVEWGANIAQSDAASLLPFMALISINLAVINILPLPALDGGQLFFLAIEALRGGKPLPQEFQENVMQTGLFLLLGLGIFLIVRDTTQLEWVQRFLQQQ